MTPWLRWPPFANRSSSEMNIQQPIHSILEKSPALRGSSMHRSCEGVTAADFFEGVETAPHGERAWRSLGRAVAFPSAEASNGPGGPGERSRRMGIFLTFGAPLQLGL